VGPLDAVAVLVKRAVDRGARGPILLFDRATSEQVEAEEPQVPARRSAGRPRLGVVAREVTLLPRHWDWLAEQPGGASVTLRRLVDQARRANVEADRVRRAREAAYQFMTAMAGNRPGFEEALRALFAGQGSRFTELIGGWPADIRSHVAELAEPAFSG
jgi:hypothetical protein